MSQVYLQPEGKVVGISASCLLITYFVEKELTGNSSGVFYYCLVGWNAPPWFGKEGEASASQGLLYGIDAFQS